MEASFFFAALSTALSIWNLPREGRSGKVPVRWERRTSPVCRENPSIEKFAFSSHGLPCPYAGCAPATYFVVVDDWGGIDVADGAHVVRRPVLLGTYEVPVDGGEEGVGADFDPATLASETPLGLLPEECEDKVFGDLRDGFVDLGLCKED